MKKLVIIDSNRMVTLMVEMLGKKQGIEVYSYNDSTDCFHFVEDISPDVLLVDLLTVEEQGSDFLNRVYEINLSKKIKIIGLISNKKVIGKNIKNIIGTINKPISPSTLFDEILKLVSGV